MALAIDGAASGKSSANSATMTATLTTANAGDIIVICVYAEDYQTPYPVITSVTVGGNAATLRNSFTWQANITFGAGGGTFSNVYNLQAIYWYYSSGTLTSASVVANMNTTYDCGIIVAFGVSGWTGTAYQTNPWDQSAATAAGFFASQPTATSTETAILSASNISTVNANSFIFSMASSDTFNVYNGSPGAIAGTTATASGAALQFNSSNVNCSAAVEYRILSSTIASASAAYTAQGGVDGGWGIATDALAIPAALVTLGLGGQSLVFM